MKFRLLLFVCFEIGIGRKGRGGERESRFVVVGISQTATGYTHSGNSICVCFIYDEQLMQHKQQAQARNPLLLSLILPLSVSAAFLPI